MSAYPSLLVLGLTDDGENLWCASRDGLHCIDPKNGQIVRTIRTNVHLRALACAPYHRRLLFIEQPEFGHDVHHQRLIVAPKPARLHRVAR